MIKAVTLLAILIIITNAASSPLKTKKYELENQHSCIWLWWHYKQPPTPNYNKPISTTGKN
ncbi:hypothetical protein ABEB36_006234 [Hypothenemus hampei]|uniref:Uncharacterized protein n=1 Tax=Hypothenemus hampei TaxID=57062 RepID=A0ABD1EPU6_HYPHA